MAKINCRACLRELSVQLKKYFYVLRPLFAAKWITNTGSAVPIEFHKLLTLLSDQPKVLDTVHVLLEQKRNTPKLGMAPSVFVFNKFIEEMLFEENFEMPENINPSELVDLFNYMFVDVLRAY